MTICSSMLQVSSALKKTAWAVENLAKNCFYSETLLGEVLQSLEPEGNSIKPNHHKNINPCLCSMCHIFKLSPGVPRYQS